jgi:hypothetical protein
MPCNTCWIRSFSSAAPDLHFLTCSWINLPMFYESSFCSYK